MLQGSPLSICTALHILTLSHHTLRLFTSQHHQRLQYFGEIKKKFSLLLGKQHLTPSPPKSRNTLPVPSDMCPTTCLLPPPLHWYFTTKSALGPTAAKPCDYRGLSQGFHDFHQVSPRPRFYQFPYGTLKPQANKSLFTPTFKIFSPIFKTDSEINLIPPSIRIQQDLRSLGMPELNFRCSTMSIFTYSKPIQFSLHKPLINHSNLFKLSRIKTPV